MSGKIERCPFCGTTYNHRFSYARRLMEVTWFPCGHELREVYAYTDTFFFGLRKHIRKAEWFLRWPPPRRGMSAIRAKVADGDKYGRPKLIELAMCTQNIPAHELAG